MWMCLPAGWTRVAYLNMFDPQQTRVSNWTLNNSPVEDEDYLLVVIKL